jgi:hypothetical protein
MAKVPVFLGGQTWESCQALFANMEDYVRIASGGARNHRRVDMRREHS